MRKVLNKIAKIIYEVWKEGFSPFFFYGKNYEQKRLQRKNYIN